MSSYQPTDVYYKERLIALSDFHSHAEGRKTLLEKCSSVLLKEEQEAMNKNNANNNNDVADVDFFHREYFIESNSKNNNNKKNGNEQESRRKTSLELELRGLDQRAMQQRRELDSLQLKADGLRRESLRLESKLVQAQDEEEIAEALAMGQEGENSNVAAAYSALLAALDARLSELEDILLPKWNESLNESHARLEEQQALNDTARARLEQRREEHEAQLDRLRRDVLDAQQIILAREDHVEELERMVHAVHGGGKGNGDARSVSTRIETLEEDIRRLQDELVAVETERLALEDEGTTLVNRILRAEEQSSRMDETMMLLKSAVIHLARDYHFMRSIQKKVERSKDKEATFKEAHNVIKVAICSMGGRNMAPALAGGAGNSVGGSLAWNVTERDIETKLDDHRVRTVFRALQEMVVAWDMMKPSTRASLSTTAEIVQNAYVLYAAARSTMHRMNVRLSQHKTYLETHGPSVAITAAATTTTGGRREDATGGTAVPPGAQHHQHIDPNQNNNNNNTPRRYSYSYGRFKRETPPSVARPSSARAAAVLMEDQDDNGDYCFDADEAPQIIVTSAGRHQQQQQHQQRGELSPCIALPTSGGLRAVEARAASSSSVAPSSARKQPNRMLVFPPYTSSPAAASTSVSPRRQEWDASPRGVREGFL
eukprot:PhM_4_TR12059/c0_g1_i1/m.5099